MLAAPAGTPASQGTQVAGVQGATQARLVEILRAVLKLPASTEVRADSHLRDQLGLDSLTSMELLVSLEDEIEGFFVNPDTIAPGHFNTVSTLAHYIDAHRQVAACGALHGQPEVQYEPV
ncbi:acyl carrier protein [Pseudomonas aegrilactucae]